MLLGQAERRARRAESHAGRTRAQRPLKKMERREKESEGGGRPRRQAAERRVLKERADEEDDDGPRARERAGGARDSAAIRRAFSMIVARCGYIFAY